MAERRGRRPRRAPVVVIATTVTARVWVVAAAATTLTLLPALLLGGLTATASAVTPATGDGTLVTVRTEPAVAGVALRLGGDIRRTDTSGTASFAPTSRTTADSTLGLASGDVDAETRVSLLHVGVDPDLASGTRRLVAQLAVSHRVGLHLFDRTGAPLSAALVTGMTVRSDDGRTTTLRPAATGGLPWLMRETAVPGAPFFRTRTPSYNVLGVRIGNVPVRLGPVQVLTPDASDWYLTLAGYPLPERARVRHAPGQVRQVSVRQVPVRQVNVQRVAPRKAVPARIISIRTMPPVPSVALRVGNQTVRTDASGTATLHMGSLSEVDPHVVLASPQAGANTRVALQRVTADPHRPAGARSLVLALAVRTAVRLAFVDLAGHPVRNLDVTSVRLRSPSGQVITLSRPQLNAPVWVEADRPAQTSPPPARWMTYTIADVTAHGTDAVFTGEQRFDPVVQPTWLVRLHLVTLRVNARDLLFGAHSTGSVVLRAPDGTARSATFKKGTATFAQLPRGDYQLVVSSAADQLTVPVHLARDQVLPARILSWRDVVTGIAAPLLLAVIVMRLGRRTSRRRTLRTRIAGSIAG